MFTGIIETLGKIEKISPQGSNLNVTLSAEITPCLKIDQSLAHNGICLTVVEITENQYVVTAIAETIAKTNLATWQVGDSINLERAMLLGDRLDGHIVQGHVDQTGVCKSIDPQDGSWIFSFEYDKNLNNITIEKGSITINGVSLTVVNSTENGFSVAIIPYTYQHTNFQNLVVGNQVNLEFDVIGKYVARLFSKTL